MSSFLQGRGREKKVGDEKKRRERKSREDEGEEKRRILVLR